MELSKIEIERYQKQALLNEFGMAGQIKLKEARVLVIGAGGLGCPLLQYLAPAGIGHIGIFDGDVIELSNLQRQILYTNQDIGKKKAEIAAEATRRLNPHSTVTAFAEFFTAKTALEIIPRYDIVVDCTDNFGTRYLVNDVCVLLNKPFVSAAIYKHEGQVGTFNARSGGSYSCNYRDLYPYDPEKISIPNCNQIGVMGILPGIIGLYQAGEVIKYFVSSGDCLVNKLLVLDAWKLDHFIIDINASIQGSYMLTREEILQTSYSLPCKNLAEFENIDVERLEYLLKTKSGLAVIDVRYENEEPCAPFQTTHAIPLHELDSKISELSGMAELIFFCQSGKRSEAACKLAKKRFPRKTIYNLKGGVLSLQIN